jgi:hypothetical protein
MNNKYGEVPKYRLSQLFFHIKTENTKQFIEVGKNVVRMYIQMMQI